MNLRHIHQYELGIDIFILVVKFGTCANLILTDPVEEKSLIDILKTFPRLSLFKRRKIIIESSQGSFIYKLKRQTTIFIN